MKIEIKLEAYNKIMHWVKSTDIEVSGFGLVEEHGDTLVVTDAYLVEQVGGAAHTDIDGEALAKLMYKVRKDKKAGKLRFWWHSHVNMNVFWSQQDKDTIFELGGNGWILATVFNKKEETRTALAYKSTTPFGTATHMDDDLTLYIDQGITDEQVKAWDEEFKANVKQKVYTPPSNGYGSWYPPAVQPRQTPLLDGVTQDYYTFDDMEEEDDIMGYGIKVEAAVLKVSEKYYANVVAKGMYDKEYKALEEKLYIALTQGDLDTYQERYNNLGGNSWNT